jgi:hypothetical protein
MKIYFDGCSFTSGRPYLSDYETQRYSRKVSEHFQAEEYNISKTGISNQRILRNFSVNYSDLLDECDLAVVQLTYRNRTEFYDDLKDDWHKINPVIPENPKEYAAKVGSDEIICRSFRKRGEKWNARFWTDYYMNVYSHKFGRGVEEMVFNSIKGIAASKNIRLIMIGVPEVDINLSYDLLLDHYPCMEKGYEPHPNQLGHLMISRDLIKMIER